MLYKITLTYSVVTGTATESVQRTALTYSLEHKMLHIINSLYFALVTTFTVQSCTIGEWYESILCVMINIDVLSHTITVIINIRAKSRSIRYGSTSSVVRG